MPLITLKAQRLSEDGNLCDFGITEAIGGVIAAGLTSAGVGAGLAGGIGTTLAGASLGAAGGAGLSAIEGKPIGKGALFGGITGGVAAGAGPLLGSGLESTGLSAGTATTLGDVGAGVAGGLLGSAATGQSPLTGALEGGAAGLVSGLAASPTSGPTGTTGTATVSPTAGATAGAGGAGAPGAVSLPATGGGATPVDLSSATTDLGISPGGSAAALGLTTPTTNVTVEATGAGGPNVGGATAGATPPTSGGFNLDSILGKLTSNPGLLLAGGALGLDLLKGNQPLPAQTAVQNAATGEASVGRTLESYQQSGTLPAGLQDIVNANTNAGIARVKSNFAQLGLSGSTMEAQAIAQVHQAASAQVAQIANQLFSQGANFTNMSNQELNTLLQTQLAQDQGLQSAIANFAGALGGARTRTPTVA